MFDDIKRGLSCDSVRDARNVRERAVCIAAHPGRMALFPFVHWFERRYRGKHRFARLAFLFDLVLLGIAVGLGLVALALAFYKPPPFEDRIVFQADVIPREVVSGAAGTLVIRYANGTGEELRGAKLVLGFPDHFLLQDVESESGEAHGRVVELGNVPPDGMGSVKIRGVMFGDVGGEQTFETELSFTHGPDNAPGFKSDAHVFRPVRSSLVLDLVLPDRILASQPVEGTLTYRNVGDVDFPEVLVEPEWPDGFVLADGSFRAPGVAAGTEGTIPFRGAMGATDGTATFAFHPSFVFGDDRYRQETLVHAAEVVPLPLRVSHAVDRDSLRPGGSAVVTVMYENVGDQALTDVRLGAESTSPFARSKSASVSSEQYPELARVEPGHGGSVTVSLPLFASVSPAAAGTDGRMPFAVRAFGTFDMDGVRGATVRDGELAYVMTSPVVLDSFARYATAGGDQIGRGPLPPIAGETTKYWIFWNVRGTTNELRDVRVEGTLGPNVSFTGRQTVSAGGSAEHDAAAGEVTWTVPSLAPTFSASSKIVGVAFEVALTPGPEQIGGVPVLLSDARVTATDAVTGAFVSASGATVTTNLPTDPMAGGKSAVEP